MKAIRYLDEMNTQIDFVVVTEDAFVGEAKSAIQLGLDDYWEDGCICFGEAVESRLTDANIPYSILYCDDLVSEEMYMRYVRRVDEEMGMEVI